MHVAGGAGIAGSVASASDDDMRNAAVVTAQYEVFRGGRESECIRLGCECRGISEVFAAGGHDIRI